MQMLSDRKARWRVRIAFLCLFVFTIVLSVGAYHVADLGKLQQSIAAREGQAALQGITDPRQIEEALRQHPSNKFLQMTAMAGRARDETDAAIEKLSSEIAPPAISRNADLGAASRSDLEALRRDLKVAEANAASFMPRYVAVLKAERDNIEKYARSLHLEQDAIGNLLGGIDKRHAEITDYTSRMLSARGEFYRAYGSYVAVLAGEFGAYKVENGQFIFPFQRTVDRYNAAAHAMSVAATRLADLEQEGKRLRKSQQERWQQLVNGK